MRRVVVVVFGLLVLIGLLVGVKFKQISKLISFGAKMEKAGPPAEVIGTSLAIDDQWDRTMAAVGSVTAVRGVAVSNEAAGVVTAIHFESGQMVRAGQVLVELDTGVERAQLASAAARRDLAEVGIGRTRKLLASEAVSKSQLDADEAQVKTSKADFGALAAQIDRKTVRAPFSGRLGIRQVNLGQYLNPGTAVTVLESVGSVYVDFSVPQQQLAAVKVGTPVQVSLTDVKGVALEGTVGAIDPTVDAATRSLKLRASIPNTADTLRAGMFVNVVIQLGDKAKVVIVPDTALVHASYGDSIFVVEPKKDEEGHAVVSDDGHPVLAARQQFVRTGQARGDFVAITDGITAGQQVVTAGAFKLRNGGSVVVNNDIKPTPEQAPHVENR